MNALKQFILINTNADTVIFYDESRVTRAITDFYTEMIIPLRVRKPQLKLYSTQHEGEWNENDPLVQMKFAIDHDEYVKKSSRVRDSQRNLFSEEKRPPYGYSTIEKGSGELLPNNEADIVVFIFYLYSYGCSNKKIAELLEAAKIPSPSGYGHWSDSSINYILTNIWYIGSLSWDRRISFSNSQKKPLNEVTVLKNHHPALIDAGLWETTQYFRSLKAKKNRMDSPFILKGLITCKDCDVELETKNQTSTKSVSDSSFYYCPLCKGRAKKTAINELVLQDFAQRWSREMKHYQKQLQAEMKS